MGQAFDRTGQFLGDAYGDTKHEVLDKLIKAHGDNAHEIRIRSMEESEVNSGASAEMPRYRCHKEVHALKIDRVQLDADTARVEERETDGSARLYVEAPYAPIRVESAYVRKHNPQAGGYYVVYEDGYTSFSPAAPFDAGYTRL